MPSATPRPGRQASTHAPARTWIRYAARGLLTVRRDPLFETIEGVTARVELPDRLLEVPSPRFEPPDLLGERIRAQASDVHGQELRVECVLDDQRRLNPGATGLERDTGRHRDRRGLHRGGQRRIGCDPRPGGGRVIGPGPEGTVGVGPGSVRGALRRRGGGTRLCFTGTGLGGDLVSGRTGYLASGRRSARRRPIADRDGRATDAPGIDRARRICTGADDAANTLVFGKERRVPREGLRRPEHPPTRLQLREAQDEGFELFADVIGVVARLIGQRFRLARPDARGINGGQANGFVSCRVRRVGGRGTEARTLGDERPQALESLLARRGVALGETRAKAGDFRVDQADVAGMRRGCPAFGLDYLTVDQRELPDEGLMLLESRIERSPLGRRE